MTDEDESSREKLVSLVNGLCQTGGLANLDAEKLKQIKLICKTDEKYIRLCHQLILTQLNKEHSEIRYSALQIADCLFQRSALFRDLILEEFQAFFDLILELDPDEELPPPRKAANALKKLAPKIIKNWHDKFAADYKLLDLGFNYLKNMKKIDFVSFSHQTVAQRNQNKKEEERQQTFLNKKFQEYLKEMNEYEEDIKNSVEQFDRCINILVPKTEEIFTNEDFNIESVGKNPAQKSDKSSIETANSSNIGEIDDDEDGGDNSDDDSDSSDDDFVEVASKKTKEEIEEERYVEMRYLGVLNADKPVSLDEFKNAQFTIDLRLQENDENKVVIEIMRDLYKEMKKSSLVRIQNWIKNFTQIKTGAASHLKRAIELKNLVQAVLKRFENLNIIDLASVERARIRDEANEKIKSLVRNSNHEENDKPGTSKSKETALEELTEKEKKKLEMLKIAPIIEIEYLAPANTQKVEAEHRFYGGRQETDDSEKTKGGVVPGLAKTTFIGRYEPVKWSCRAPLKNGRLCPRMDRFKCPLHGKIVARDEKGEITNEQDRIEFEKRVKAKEKPAWQDAELIADINAATGLNLQVVGDKSRKRKSGDGEGKSGLSSKKEKSKRKSLERKLLNPKNMSKIGSILDSIERRQHYEKFHHNFNYAFDS